MFASYEERNFHKALQIHLFSQFESSVHILRKCVAQSLEVILKILNSFLYKERQYLLSHE